MKTVTLIRHAKSSWEHELQDVERPLSARGYSDANLLSKILSDTTFQPDAVFSSPANRALTTCTIFIDALKLDRKQLTIKDELYDFEGRQVVNFIRNLDNSLHDILIFGHNNAFTAIANNYGDEYVDNVPTCGLVKIQFETNTWENIDKGHTILTLFPSHLKS